MSQTIKLEIDSNNQVHDVSPDLYGIFIEDINFTCDGGLNANMVNNYSFDGVYIDPKKKTPVYDYLRYWHMENGEIISLNENPLSENSRYARITVNEKSLLSNLGYNNLEREKDEGAMAISESADYLFRVFIRNVDFVGTAHAAIQDIEGNPLTDSVLLDVSNPEWSQTETSLTGRITSYGKLVITFEGEGSIDLDCIEFMNKDTWNKDDPKWKHGKLRKDLVQALADLKPAFVRFPGGCIIEGIRPGNEYNWKDTVGPIWDRKSNYNLWGEKVEDGGYNQSYQIGFYEYFCLCEDLNAKPLPTLYAGLNCQPRAAIRLESLSENSTDIHSPEFNDYVVKNYLDLIEFATGDPEENEWAALRSRMGHPEPFYLDRIGIGNENFGDYYREAFSLIKEAINRKYPDIKCVMAAGLLPHKMALRNSWEFAEDNYDDILVDEHSYHSPAWFRKAARRFDNYPRGTAKVYFGEYAANGVFALKFPTEETSNSMESALAEAAFLTGIERNSDVVEMTSYAPLFYMAGSKQWVHNLIYFNPSTLCHTANYMVQKMFSNHIGKHYVASTGELPENVYSSVTSDESNLYIKLVNTDETEIEALLQLRDIENQTADAEILRSISTKVKNKLEFFGPPAYNVNIKSDVFEVSDGELHIKLPANSVTVLTVRHTS